MAIDYTIEELKARTSIVDVVKHYMPNIKPQGREYLDLCPFHKEKTPSFTVVPDKDMFYCHGCGAGSSSLDFIMQYENLDTAEAVKRLKWFAGVEDQPDQQNQPQAEPVQRESPERSVDPMELWQPIMPVPVGAPKLMNDGKTNPIYNPKTDRLVEYRPEPDGVYPYKNAIGEVVGAVLRIMIDGKKLTPTVTYCVNTETGEEKWCVRGFPEPKPLYNIDRWFNDRPVIVVEGERCVDAAQAKIAEFYDITSWPNGTNAIQKADWSPLYGRDVTLWADNDLQLFKRGPREGEMKPQDEQNGRKAMLWLKNHLEDNGSTVTLLDQPEIAIDGWDCADAAEEGRDMMQFIADHTPKPVKQAKQESAATHDSGHDEPAQQEPIDPNDRSLIVRPLGYSGDSFYYYSTQTQQLRELKDREHTESRMLAMADQVFWTARFPKPKSPGIDVSEASDWMMSACRMKGIYDPKTVRGRGCWMDDGRFVIHLGDRLIVDGHTVTLNDFKSRYLYQAAMRMRTPKDALTDEEAKRVLEAAKAFDWEMPASGALLAGWCAVAPLCGALPWRPHLWLLGQSGSGKSYIYESYISPLIGDMGVHTALESSEAGLRQDLNGDALPAIFEEFDPKNKRDTERAQGFFNLMRLASNDSKIRILRGSTGGKSSSFSINSMFCLIGVSLKTNEQAILNRTAKLALRSRPNHTQEQKANNKAQFRQVQDVVNSAVTDVPNISERLFARTASMAHILMHNIEVFRSAALSYFGNARYADQYGTLLAGAYSLASDCKIKEETALRYIASFDWSSYTEESDVNESDQALADIMQITLRVEGNGMMKTRSIGEWIQYVHERKSDDPERLMWRDADEALKRCGIKYENDGIGGASVHIANKSKFLETELRDEVWGQNWSRYLKRALSSRGLDMKSTGVVYFVKGLQSRSVSIPYDMIESIGV